VMATLLLAAAVAGDDRREEALAAIEAVRQTTVGGAEFLDGARVVYVLGRGPSLASAHEGALLFNETAKLPSVGMPCGGFRHGPVEVVDQDFRAFVFASQPQTRDLDLALASYIEAKGGKVRLIQAEPGFFTPAVEVIPLQYAAYHAAEARGFVPGRFRYVSLVTTSETNFDRH
jgi:glucosamine--fructose-6-phosphate aminotransferase (isomerizing)